VGGEAWKISMVSLVQPNRFLPPSRACQTARQAATICYSTVVPSLQPSAVLRELCPTRCSDSGSGCCSRMGTHIDGLCDERRASHDSTRHSPLFFLRWRCSAPRRLSWIPPIGAVPSLPACLQGATAAKAVAESAFWSGTNEGRINFMSLYCICICICTVSLL
jgi:hypothetical protein